MAKVLFIRAHRAHGFAVRSKKNIGNMDNSLVYGLMVIRNLECHVLFFCVKVVCRQIEAVIFSSRELLEHCRVTFI